MTTTLTPRRFSVGDFLWLKVDPTVRAILKCGVPHDVQEWDGSKGLLVSVGPSNPMRWLYLGVGAGGLLHGELHQIMPKGMGTKVVGEFDCTPQTLGQQLRVWAVEYNLSG